MAYILDGVILLIVLLGLWLGYRHGLVRTLVRLVGCVMALVLAAMLSQTVAESIFDGYLQEKLETTIAQNVSITEGSTIKEDIGKALEGLPDGVQNMLNNSGVVDRALDTLDDTVTYKEAEITQTIITYIVRPVAVALLGIIVFLILFVLLMVVVSLLAKLLGGILKLPVLRQINGVLGAVIGVLEGVLVALVVVALMQMTAASTSSDAWLTQQDIDDTILVSHIAKDNPITEQWNILPENKA